MFVDERSGFVTFETLSIWMTDYDLSNYLSYAAAAACRTGSRARQRHFMQEGCHLSRVQVKSRVCAAHSYIHPPASASADMHPPSGPPVRGR